MVKVYFEDENESQVLEYRTLVWFNTDINKIDFVNEELSASNLNINFINNHIGDYIKRGCKLVIEYDLGKTVKWKLTRYKIERNGLGHDVIFYGKYNEPYTKNQIKNLITNIIEDYNENVYN